MSIAGLDIGTTGCKVMIFSTDGAVLAREFREYPILTPHPHWVEQDAEFVWDLLKSALHVAASAVPGDPPRALAISAQGEAVIPVDDHGRALRPAILGMDTRTTAQNLWLKQKFGGPALYQRTGMPVFTINTLPKLLWIKQNEPEIWNTAAQFLLYEDFVVRKLTGRAVTSRCLASRTQMYDIHTNEWAADILDTCEIDPGRLAMLAPDGFAPVGTVSKEMAGEIGLQGDVLVAAGGHDQACAALGSGVTRAGRAMVSTGTAEVVEVALAAPAVHQNLAQGGISIYRHVLPDLYLAMTLNHSGGLLLRWFRDQFCRWAIGEEHQTGKNAYDLILGDVPEGPTPLLVLPHFSGSGTPTLDTTSKGAVLGLSFATDQPTLAKAILEGLTFELKINLDLLLSCGIPIRQLYAVGGGANSPLWLQLKADICGIPLNVPRVTDAACLGAAMLSGTACGAYKDLDTAVSQLAIVDKTIRPDPQLQKDYASRFKVYQKVYPALADLNREL